MDLLQLTQFHDILSMWQCGYRYKTLFAFERITNYNGRSPLLRQGTWLTTISGISDNNENNYITDIVTGPYQRGRLHVDRLEFKAYEIQTTAFNTSVNKHYLQFKKHYFPNNWILEFQSGHYLI